MTIVDVKRKYESNLMSILRAKIRGIDPKKDKEYFRKLIRSEISKEVIKGG